MFSKTKFNLRSTT